jgi:hypothetical protein
VFDDWQAAGPEADDYWMRYEQQRGHGYIQALDGPAANHVFDFDLHWLKWADTGVLLTPAGKSGYSELSWLAGRGVPTYILLDAEPERWDVMAKFHKVVSDVRDLAKDLEPRYDGRKPVAEPLWWQTGTGGLTK